MAVRITQFGGIVPRTSPRLIADNAAQVAVNCRVSTGELIPYNQPSSVYTSSKPAPLLTIYRGTDYTTGNYAWLTWGADVDVARTTFYGTSKWVYTGDGEPRITNYAGAISGVDNKYPDTGYVLGIPTPVTACSIAPSGGSATNVSRYYVYTFYTSWDGVEMEGPSSPLSALTTAHPDGTWAISGMDASPASSGSCTGAYASSKTTVTTAVPHWLRVGEQVKLGTNSLVVTDVVSATQFKVAGDYHTEVTWSRVAAFPGTFYKRLYRTSGTTAQFQLVAESISGTTYSDTLTDAQILGDELISSDWSMPPVGLTGIISLPSGALCGFLGTQVWFSEPYQPHAWPTSNILSSDFPVVSLGSFGTGVVATTQSRPFIMTGVEPGQISGQMWEEVLPCASKNSTVSIGDSVIYASQTGFISVNSTGAQNWSLGYFTVHEFQNYAPATMVGAFANRRLYMLYDNGVVNSILIFNLTGDDQYLTEAHVDASTLYADDTTGYLYFSNNTKIYQFDPSTGYPMSQDWMGKDIVLPKPMNLGAAKINFDVAITAAERAAILAEIARITALNAPMLATGKVNGGWGMVGINDHAYDGSDFLGTPANPPSNEVSFNLFAGGKLRFSKTVTDTLPFHLPSGYKVDTVTVEVLSQCSIKSIELGETKSSLATV